jgi:TrmH family RNA methyltransferase
MGAVFAVPLARAADVGELPAPKVALVAGRGDPLHSLDPMDNVTLIVGGERDGLPEDVIARADRVVHIPIETESLNAAMAATIALYEVSRISRA